MSVTVPEAWDDNSDLDDSILSGREVWGKQFVRLATGYNYLAGWRFLRCVELIYDHDKAVHGNGVKPTVQSTETLAPRWHTTPDATHLFVLFTYYVPDEISPSVVPKVTLEIRTDPVGANAIHDNGCEFDTLNGGLRQGFGSDANVVEEGRFLGGYMSFPGSENDRVPRSANTGIQQWVGYTTLTENPRPLNLPTDTECSLNIKCVETLIYSVFAWEAHQSPAF